MLRKLALVASLTAIVGGVVLAAPAFARNYPDCEQLLGTPCSPPGSTTVCQWEGRYLDGLYCDNGTWQ